MRARERKILEVISAEPITTQAELAAALRRAGLRLSQATVSRAIKRLGLVKVRSANGKARYLPAPEAAGPPADLGERLRRAFRDYVDGVDEGSGLVVVKTTTGSAATVAEAIDEMRWPDVTGTVAGDNTIIVIPRRRPDRLGVRRRLEGLLT